MQRKKKYGQALYMQMRPPKEVKKPRRLPARSATKVMRDLRYSMLTEVWWTDPANSYCIGCIWRMLAKVQFAMDVHHYRGKIGDLYFDKRFWLPVCRQCHEWIDKERVEARKLGLLCKSGYNDMRQPDAYTKAYRTWKRLKKIGQVMPNEKEPDHTTFDLSDWEAKKLRETVDNE